MNKKRKKYKESQIGPSSETTSSLLSSSYLSPPPNEILYPSSTSKS